MQDLEGSPTGSDLAKEMPKADDSRVGLTTSGKPVLIIIAEYAGPPDSY
jgi:hypothetical protein